MPEKNWAQSKSITVYENEAQLRTEPLPRRWIQKSPS